MLKRLAERANDSIRVGLVGAGAMGRGIAWQVSRTAGMVLAFITDLNLEAAQAAARQIGLEPVELKDDQLVLPAPGQVLVGTDTLAMLAHSRELGLHSFV